MKGVYFISGIDTDAGKSYVTGHLARLAMKRGVNTTTMKFIQTGGLSPNGYSIDIEIHRQLMNIDYTEHDKKGVTAPVVFSYPASPHLAAKLDNKSIDYAKINESIDILSKEYDLLLIEGAGGLHVPLDDKITTIDYVKNRGFKTILATSGKLGSINHTILSLEALKHRDIEVYMVVYNHFFGKNDKIINNDTCEYLKNYLKKHLPKTIFLEIDK